jgi:hypothetical protein
MKRTIQELRRIIRVVSVCMASRRVTHVITKSCIERIGKLWRLSCKRPLNESRITYIGVNIRRPLANGGQNFMASLLTGAVSDASSRLEVMK